MYVPEIEKTDEPAPAARQFLEDRIYDYNVAATGTDDGRLLYLTCRDAEGAVVAALSSWTWGGCLEIEFLWVREDHRRDGYGSRLLAAAEAEGIARGATQAVVSTHSFQAPDFYRKHGYAIYGAVEDYPRGHRHLHLRKRLAAGGG